MTLITRPCPCSLLLCALLVAPLLAQDASLIQKVDAYLSEPVDAAATRLLRELLGEVDATGNAVLAAVRARREPIARTMTVTVPHRDQALRARITTPEGHGPESQPLPVVLDVSGGHNAPWLFRGTELITVGVEGYSPPQFSDEGRDGLLKILRTAAHVARGDPLRLWMTGFSWAAHAACDTALHRPGFICGIAPLGGGPRRVHFRLLPNLSGSHVFAFCGGKDDAELVWNLRELALRARKHHYECTLAIDATKGHTLPLATIEDLGARIVAAKALAPLAAKGRLLADGALVENPLLRIDAVKGSRVRVPRRVPVSASLSYDAKRRATIRAMRDRVASVSWRIERGKQRTTITLKSSGTKACTLFLRGPRFTPGDEVVVRAGRKIAFKGTITADARVVLEEARRTGARLRPAFARIDVSF